MKVRIIAFIILLILIGLPIFGYWYFYRANIASVEIILSSDVEARVHLKGTFAQSWLPLADKAIDYETNCIEKCVFSPVLPAQYKLSVSSPNFVEFSEHFSLKNGEKIVKNIELTRGTQFAEMSIPQPLNADEKILRQDDIWAILGKEYTLIDRDIFGNFWVVKNENPGISLGIFQGGQFVARRTFPTNFSDITLDFLGNIFIFSLSENEKILATPDFENILQVKIPEKSRAFSFENNIWYAKTPEKTLMFKNDIWQENPRFSHFVDIGKWRAGYIRSDAENLLKLSNYSPSEGSVLVLLDRENGDIFQVARALDISELFVYNGQIIFKNGNYFYSIKIPE